MLHVPSVSYINSHLILKEKHDTMLYTLKKNYRLCKCKNVNIVSRKKNPTWEESNEEILAKGQVCHLSIVESYPTSLKGQGKLFIFTF